MKKLLFAILLVDLFGCASKPSNELEDISKDVLKARQGIEIEIKPLPKEAK
jgi:hypothetical protein